MKGKKQKTVIITMAAILITTALHPFRTGGITQVLAADKATELSEVTKGPKEDFYEYVNKPFMENASIPDGHYRYSAFQEIDKKVKGQIELLLDEMSQNEYEDGSKEQIVSDFYNNMKDIESANQDGIAPVKPILDKIDNAGTISELIEADCYIANSTGQPILFSFILFPDYENSSKTVKTLAINSLPLCKNDYLNERPIIKKAYINMLEELQVLAGVDKEDANKNALDIYKLEKAVARKALNPGDSYNPELSVWRTDIKGMCKKLPLIEATKIAGALGINLYNEQKMYVLSADSVKKFASYFKESNLELLKAFTKTRFLYYSSEMLSDSFRDTVHKFKKEALGINAPLSRKQWAINVTLDELGEYVGELYAGKLASKKAKADVEAMAYKFIDIYKERILRLDWMSERTKASALKKLNTLNVKVGYPDSWQDKLAGCVIKPYSEGGSIFESICAVSRIKRSYELSKQDRPVDKTEWGMNPYTVNAYYSPVFNEIVFPSGILNPPFYDENAAYVENLGAIGVVIAHEISHAFDNNGARFDENGCFSNWWEDKDYKAFKEKVDKIEKLYDKIEIAPGIKSNGKLTVGENIADLGGVSCALEVAKKDPGYNARKFFEAFAKAWWYIATEEGLENENKVNTHAHPKVRVNRTLQNFDEFYEAYGITDNDAMYIPYKDRIKIW